MGSFPSPLPGFSLNAVAFSEGTVHTPPEYRPLRTPAMQNRQPSHKTYWNLTDSAVDLVRTP
jgi:hypothetical protein